MNNLKKNLFKIIVIICTMPTTSGYQNREIDAVIELSEGDWCAFEMKLGANQIDTAAANLLSIKKQMEEDPMGKPPVVLCVICGLSNAAYRRPDGVFVVPITAMKM